MAKSKSKKSKAPSKPAPKAKTKAKPKAAQAAPKKAAKKMSGKKPAKAAATKKSGAPGKVIPFKASGKSSGAFKKRFTPLDDRVLVEPVSPAERTAGGLYIPETVQERPSQGKVLAVGRGARKKKGGIRPMDVKLGDSVLYGAHSGVPLELEGRNVILLKEDEILGVLKS